MKTVQPSLFPPIVAANEDPGASLPEQFAAFHAANPHVYRALVRLARDLRKKGIRRWGIKNLFERLRFDYAIATSDAEFRLNNNWTAFYARLIMDNEPDLAGFFETRCQRYTTKKLEPAH